VTWLIITFTHINININIESMGRWLMRLRRSGLLSSSPNRQDDTIALGFDSMLVGNSARIEQSFISGMVEPSICPFGSRRLIIAALLWYSFENP